MRVVINWVRFANGMPRFQAQSTRPQGTAVYDLDIIKIKFVVVFQIFGCPMGSPVSAILANLVMEHVEERALSTAPHPPKWWYRYVDDSHVCLAREHLTEFHFHLNLINQHIKFTVEEESDRSIAFLDTKTTRNTDGSIKTSVYRKATHTDKYLHFNSHHPLQHKRSVARTLLDRAKNIPSTDEDKNLKYNTWWMHSKPMVTRTNS